MRSKKHRSLLHFAETTTLLTCFLLEQTPVQKRKGKTLILNLVDRTNIAARRLKLLGLTLRMKKHLLTRHMTDLHHLCDAYGLDLKRLSRETKTLHDNEVMKANQEVSRR